MRRFSQSRVFRMLKLATRQDCTSDKQAETAATSMPVRDSDPKGIQIGREGKGKRAG